MEKQLLTNSKRKPTRTYSLTFSEIMTVLITFYVIGFRNFKSYYIHLQQFHFSKFRKLVSYNRFIELIQRTLVPLCCFTQSLSKIKTGCYFMDATATRFAISKEPMRTGFLNRLLLKVKPAPVGFFWIKVALDNQ